MIRRNEKNEDELEDISTWEVIKKIFVGSLIVDLIVVCAVSYSLGMEGMARLFCDATHVEMCSEVFEGEYQ